MKYLTIEKVVSRELNAGKILTRCCEETVFVGDLLKLFPPSAAAESSVPVKFEVQRILVYGRSLSMLETGLTAEILLSGNAIYLEDGWHLRG